MKKLLFFLSAIVFVMACNNQPQKKSMNTEMTYLALGDSYTIGESVEENDRFPVLLAKSLKDLNIKVAHPKIIAKTGWTTDELKAAIVDSALTETYDMVSLLIGVNNQYRGRDTAEYRQQYAELLDMAIGFAGKDPKKVIVVSIPDWSVSPFAKGRDLEKIAKEIDAFNAIKKEETEKRGVCFVGITEVSRLAKDKPEYIASDGLHFSGLMHQLWVDEILKTYFKK